MAAPGTLTNVPGADCGRGFRTNICRTTPRLLQHLFVWLLLTTVIIDGFPSGILLLKEFGSRPTNLLLVGYLGALVFSRWTRREPIAIGAKNLHIYASAFFVLMSSNIAIAIMESRVGETRTIIQWSKQSLMLSWGISSYALWKSLIRRYDWKSFSALATASALLPITFFFLDYFLPSHIANSLLYFVRHRTTDRPSGFATEPSIYGAWAAFLWPLVLYSAKRSIKPLARMRAWLVLSALGISAVLSDARTFVVLLLFQFAYLSSWLTLRRQHWGRKIRYILTLLLVTLSSVIVFLPRIMTVIHFSSSGSDLVRLAFTVTGIRVAMAHPLFGVGIGEFGHFFNQYVPSFALKLLEVQQLIYGISTTHASTFNIFVRFLVEFGIPLGLSVSAFLLFPFFKVMRSSVAEPFLIYAALSAVGGVGFWMSQDQYGYQPAIVALAVLSLVLRTAKITHGSINSSAMQCLEIPREPM